MLGGMAELNPPMSPVEAGHLAPYLQTQEEVLERCNLVDDALWNSLVSPEDSGTIKHE